MIYNIQFVIICWAEVKTARKSAYNLFAPAICEMLQSGYLPNHCM